MTKIKSFKVLVNPANGCWLVRVPDLDQSATVESLEDVEAAARSLLLRRRQSDLVLWPCADSGRRIRMT